MLSEDIEMVDHDMNEGGVWSSHREAWCRIKTALAELGTTPNTQSKPCRFVKESCAAPKRNPCRTGIGVKGRYGCYRA
jgi:hypothetical protein